jgi:hypothetical protein
MLRLFKWESIAGLPETWAYGIKRGVSDCFG